MKRKCAVCRDEFIIGGKGMLSEDLCHDDEWSCYSMVTRAKPYGELRALFGSIRQAHAARFREKTRVGR